jgi:hypothetical protein
MFAITPCLISFTSSSFALTPIASDRRRIVIGSSMSIGSPRSAPVLANACVPRCMFFWM